MSRADRPIRFGLVLAGMCFFFNPSFAAVDLLPDFIGCLLIWLGLSRAAVVSAPMAEARSAFLKLAAVDLAKFFALMVVFGSGSSTEQPVSLLIIAFSAAVVGLYFFTVALRALFEGFSSLSVTYDCVALYQTRPSGRSRTEEVARFATLFVFLREIICLVPEFTALSLNALDGLNTRPMYDHIGVMRLLACVAVLVLGVIYLVRVCKFFALLGRERALCEGLGARYGAHIQAHPGIAVERRHTAAFLLLGLGAFLLADFQLDFRNVIPDAAAAGCLLLGVLLLDVSKKRLQYGTAALAAAYGVIATVSSNFAYAFNSTYGEVKGAEAEDAYLSLWLSSLGEFLVFLALLACICLLLHATVLRYAGYLPEHKSEFELDALTGLREELDRGLMRSYVILAISALASFLFDYIKEIPYDGFWRILEFFWFFDFCLALLSATVFAFVLAAIHREIRARYRFD